MNHSTIMIQKLHSEQERLKLEKSSLSQHVITRWNSLFKSIRQCVLNHEAIDTVLSPERKYRSYVFEPNELKLLKTALPILQIFLYITDTLSGENYVTSSLIIPSILYIKSSLNELKVDNEKDKDFHKLFVKALLTYLDYYIEKYNIFENEFLITATFLNPKYKKFSNASEEDKKRFIKKASNYLIKLFVERPNILKSLSVPVTQPNEETSSNEKKSRMSDSEDEDSGEQGQVTVAKLRAELKQYINEPKQKNAAEFWAVMEKSQNKPYPILCSFIPYFFSVPATSTPSERLFSSTGYQVWDRRNRLKPVKVEEIMFLYDVLIKED